MAQIFQLLQVFHLALAVYDLLQKLQHTLGSDPAGTAFSAGFPLGKAHEETRHLYHTGMFIHDNQSAGSHDGPVLLDGIEIQGNVQMLLCQTAAGGTSDLNRLKGRTGFQAATDIKDNLAKGRSHGNLNQTGILDAAGQREGLGSRASFCTDAAIPLMTLQHDLRNVRIGLYVIQNGRLRPQSLFYGTGRLYTGHAAVSLDGGCQGRTLAAYKGSRSLIDMHMEIETGAEDVLAQESIFLQYGNGMLQPRYRVRILRTHINIAVLCAYRIGRQHHTFDQTVGITFHNGAVHECSGVALVAVTYHIVNRVCLTGYLNPLLACREAAAAAAAQSGLVYFLDDLIRRHLKHSFLKRVKAAAGYVFF